MNMNHIYEELDFYSKKAKKAGYAARSVYKLEEIDQKFKLLKKGMKIADLGCAPGSWSQYVSKIVGNTGLVVAIDYKKILCAAPNIVLVHGNFTKEENKAKIAEYAPFHGIISDMAPDTSGDRLTDCYNSSNLVRSALTFSNDNLKRGGFFVAKIFQGGDEKEIMSELKKNFETAKWFKPNSSRKNSFETFIIGISFHGKQEEKTNKYFKPDYDPDSGIMPW